MILYKAQSKWHGITKCDKCRNTLTINEVIHSIGICPHCGHDSESTICDYYNVIVRRNIVVQLNSNFPYIHKYVDIEQKEQ